MTNDRNNIIREHESLNEELKGRVTDMIKESVINHMRNMENQEI